MDKIKDVITTFQKKLVDLGFDEEQTATLLYEVVVVATAKLGEADLSFLSADEKSFVSNKDLMQLTPEQLQDITGKSPNLLKYLDIYATELESAIKEFDKIVDDVKEEEEQGQLKDAE